MVSHLSDNSHQKEYQLKHSMKMHLLRINGNFRFVIFRNSFYQTSFILGKFGRQQYKRKYFSKLRPLQINLWGPIDIIKKKSLLIRLLKNRNSLADFKVNNLKMGNTIANLLNSLIRSLSFFIMSIGSYRFI